MPAAGVRMRWMTLDGEKTGVSDWGETMGDGGEVMETFDLGFQAFNHPSRDRLGFAADDDRDGLWYSSRHVANRDFWCTQMALDVV